jgi:hypothetical protein
MFTISSVVMVEDVAFVLLDCALAVNETICVEFDVDSKSGIAIIIAILRCSLFIVSA